MKLLGKPFTHWVAICLLFLTSFLFNGCRTGSPSTQPIAEAPVLPPASENPAPAPVSAIIAANAPLVQNLNPVAVRLRIGDLLTISYSDTSILIPPYEGRIKDDGSITIPPYSQTFTNVAGKNVRQLEQEIRARYVTNYFRNLTVSVKTETQFFTVDGEVKNPNRYIYSGQITVLQAIATAQGFTDYAKKTNVQVIRADGTKEIVNCVKALKRPELDLPIYPGDKINVPRRVFF